MVLFDTHSMLFRAFHALPPMTTSENEPTGALYGMCALFLKVLREHRPRALAFATDSPRPTFRHEQYTEYKANRAPVPAPLVAQLQRLPELLAASDVPVWCAPGYEADDVLATLSERLSRGPDACDVLIVSGDRDLLQLVDERVRVWFIGARGKPATLFDVDAVHERFGVAPDRLPAWTALVGDASDNLIGAPGIGTRTATQLVSTYGSVAAILKDASKLRDAVRKSLHTHGERLLVNEELARLRRDVPLDLTPAVKPLTATSIQRLGRLFNDLQFRSLLPRLAALKPDG